MSVKRRLGSWRPVGAVDCPRCDNSKQSGGYYVIRVKGSNGHGTEKRLMCDGCKRTFKKWYKSREDSSGWVVIDNV